MSDERYCYHNSNILINKLNITNAKDLFEAEKELTYIRLRELQEEPILGSFNFQHLLNIHHYIFQDLYEWAGNIRKVEIGKGNLFCTVACIESYGTSVFEKFYAQCFANKDNKNNFVKVFAENYADLNALHPFREGNGRTQREFARLICLDCRYVFDLSCTTHEEMLQASQVSFNTGDCSLLNSIFTEAIVLEKDYLKMNNGLQILSSDDLIIDPSQQDYQYNYYESDDISNITDIELYYQTKTQNNYAIIAELEEQLEKDGFDPTDED